MHDTVKQNSTDGFYVFMADSADLSAGLAGLTLAVTLSKAGATEASVSPTVTDRGDGLYWIAPIASHRNTLGECAWKFTATGAITSVKIQTVIANDLADVISGQSDIETDIAAVQATVNTINTTTGTISANVSTIDTNVDTANDRLGYTLAVLAGTCSTANSATPSYAITITDTFTVAYTGADTDGNRTGQTLTKS